MTAADVAGFDRRAREAERGLRASFDVWVAAIQDAAVLSLIAEALRTGAPWALMTAIDVVRQPAFDLAEAAGREARAVLRLLGDRQPQRQRVMLRFDIRDPAFATSVLDHNARLVRDVTVETRTAIALTVARAYRLGLHPYDFAPTVRQAVGLTSRQSLAVVNYTRRLRARGTSPERVSALEQRYAARLHRQRARMIARTETIRGANLGRYHGFRQAAAGGLVDTDAALEWDATLDRRVCAICMDLDGTRSPLDEPDFAGYGLPPAHPHCRCTIGLA